jgi:hypothetical protein
LLAAITVVPPLDLWPSYVVLEEQVAGELAKIAVWGGSLAGLSAVAELRDLAAPAVRTGNEERH